ncbi:hypothetical protein EIZ62_08855 [Streptomyces ficellus]|uniref:Uncharacterized protein n=1 Tax=Streptomyces ficellus TaxID=1977088 RepID=A0A6I6F6D1_9ACTN|nr:hypothetical protein EIZ62_08855 [Streptomyces ficellus]
MVGPENEKTPRGCERSARGSETRCPLPRGFCRDSVVTADRRAAAHNHGGSKHVRKSATDVKAGGPGSHDAVGPAGGRGRTAVRERGRPR